MKFFVNTFLICLCGFWWMYMYIDRQYNCMPWSSKWEKLLYSNVFLVDRGLSYLCKERSWYDDLENLKTYKNIVGFATWHSDLPSCGSSLLISAMKIVPLTHHQDLLLALATKDSMGLGWLVQVSFIREYCTIIMISFCIRRLVN